MAFDLSGISLASPGGRVTIDPLVQGAEANSGYLQYALLGYPGMPAE